MPGKPRLLTVVQLDKVAHTLFFLLSVSLLMVADGYVLILISRVLGIYLLLAATASTGLIAVVAILLTYRSLVARMRETVAADQYPAAEFRAVTCLWVAAVLLILPGFVTDAIGIAVLIPPLRWLVGFWGLRLGKRGFDELCEYLRLGD